MGRALPFPGHSQRDESKEGNTEARAFDTSLLTKHLWGSEDLLLRARVLELFKEDVFKIRYGETVAMKRARTRARVARLREAGMFEGLEAEDSREESNTMRRYDVVVGAIALLDHSLEVYIGVNFGLFGSTVYRLGSEEQRAKWFSPVMKGQEFGCFALTELGHGSNVRGIETTATYDVQRQAFRLKTPNEAAQKFWIGGAAESATLSVVFARLILKGVDKGVHVFVVRLRDGEGNITKGITIADCGVKAGLNGVDNGRLWFDDLWVPRVNMLSKNATVAPDGTYNTSFASPDALFAATLAALTGGRVGIAYNAITNAMIGLSIAIQYCNNRRAFAPKPHLPEVPLLYYTSMQRRLMIPLAGAIVYLPCAQVLREDWYNSAGKGVSRDFHSMSAGYKALFSWYMMDALQAAREACGGQGYALHNRIAVLRSDRDVMTTFEGANEVLLQQVGKALLASHFRAMKTGGLYRDPNMLALNGSTTNDEVGVMIRREKELLKLLGAQYGMARTTTATAFDAWNLCLDVAQRASRAHIHRRIAEMHARTVVEQRDEGVKGVLRICGALWAAAELSADPDVQRLGCVDATQARAIADSVPKLCRELNALSHLVVEAFDIPDHLLAPIAGDYVEYYSRAKL